MNEISWVNMIYQFIVIGLIVLFVISFTFFIRRLLLNSTNKNIQLNEIAKKLDKIIDLLEEDKR